MLKTEGKNNNFLLGVKSYCAMDFTIALIYYYKIMAYILMTTEDSSKKVK